MGYYTWCSKRKPDYRPVRADDDMNNTEFLLQRICDVLPDDYKPDDITERSVLNAVYKLSQSIKENTRKTKTNL